MVRSEGSGPEPPLAGVTFVVKDVIDIAGTVTGAGNPDWAAGRAPADEDAAAVRALLRAGATLRGKGQCAELAFSLSGDNAHYGMPVNAAAPGRDPGGSTSGPAAAVAGGLCDLGVGTDTLGSIRVPASYCGLYGYRPTSGGIPTDGVLPLAQRFDTVGLLAGDPLILRRAAGVLLGTPPDLASPPRRLLMPAAALRAADPPVADATRAAADVLSRRLGAAVDHVEAVGPGAPAPEAALAAFGVLQGREVWANFGAWVEAAQPSFGGDVGARIERAARITAADVAESEPVAVAAATALGRLGEEDALVLPSAGTVAPARDAGLPDRERARSAAGQLTCLASLAGAPAISLPLASVEGLPVGIGLVAAPGADRMLLAALDSAAGAVPA